MKAFLTPQYTAALAAGAALLLGGFALAAAQVSSTTLDGWSLAFGPEVEYHMWEEVSHFLMLERPEELNELLTDFVNRLPGCR